MINRDESKEEQNLLFEILKEEFIKLRKEISILDRKEYYAEAAMLDNKIHCSIDVLCELGLIDGDEREELRSIMK